MARNKVLVKNLSVIETLSCVNVIASDKTGTLTQNKMYVTNSCAGLTIVNAKTARRASTMGDTSAELKSSLQLLNTCILCNEAKFEEEVPTHSMMSRRASVKPVNELKASGGATDVAILKYGANYLEIDEVEENYETLDKQVGFIPFNSRNKWMARVFKPNRERIAQSGDCFNLSDDECVVTMKGYILILFITLKAFKS
jgi:sodium/potassium-transporting ATPase subunit alpha